MAWCIHILMGYVGQQERRKDFYEQHIKRKKREKTYRKEVKQWARKRVERIRNVARTSCTYVHIQRMGFKEVKAPIGSVRKIFFWFEKHFELYIPFWSRIERAFKMGIFAHNFFFHFRFSKKEKVLDRWNHPSLKIERNFFFLIWFKIFTKAFKKLRRKKKKKLRRINYLAKKVQRSLRLLSRDFHLPKFFALRLED